MKKTIILAALSCALCWGQHPADCKPNVLNVPEAKYPCIFPDNRVMFRVMAPDAQKVRVSLGGGLIRKLAGRSKSRPRTRARVLPVLNSPSTSL